MKIAFWKHFPQVDQDGKMLAKATIDYQRRFNFDFVKLTPAGTWLAVCYGAKDEYKQDHLGSRGITHPYITHQKQWQDLPLFSQVQHPEMLCQQLITSSIVCETIDDVPVYASVFSPLSQAIQLAGIETFRQHLELYPAEIEIGLQRITQNTCYVLSLFADTGIRGLFYVMQHLQENIFSAANYEKVAIYDEICLKHAASLFNDILSHLHGENVYWGLSISIPKMKIHYGTHTTNLNFEELAEVSQLPIVAGIPSTELVSAHTDIQVKQLLEFHFGKSVNSSTSLLTCDCVLPLSFSDEQTDFWIKSTAQL